MAVFIIKVLCDAFETLHYYTSNHKAEDKIFRMVTGDHSLAEPLGQLSLDHQTKWLPLGTLKGGGS